MNYDLSYDYVAVMVMTLLLIIYRGKRKAPLPIYRVNYVLSYTILIAAVLDIVTVWVMRHPDIFSINSIYLVNVCYLIVQNYVFVVYAVYELYVSGVNVKKSTGWKWLLHIPYAMAVALILTTPLTKWIFYVDEQGGYYHADGFVALYGLMGYYGIICIIIMVKYRKSLEADKIAYMSGIYIMACMAQLVQMINPTVLMVAFICALSMIILLYAVQTPDEIFDATNALYRKYYVQAVSSDFTSARPFKTLFICLHDYDILNESFGEEEVNRVLRGMCGYLRSVCSEGHVFRMDEKTYAFKLPDLSDEETDALIAMIGERFRSSWSNGFMEVVLPVSFVKVACPRDIGNMDDLNRMLSLLPGKELQIHEVLEVKDFAGEDENRNILQIIKDAVEHSGFEVHYQPIYSVKKKKVIAAEALVRLYDEKIGYISPEKFVPLAEKEGYILKIGEFVFEEVCKFYAENKLQDIGIEYIEVNLSAVQCMKHEMARELIAVMEKYGLTSKQINFEITETSAVISNPELTANVNSLREYGIDLSLDDYGTGYSNLSYLYHIPFRFIKIDKSILWSAEQNDKAEITLKNIFHMAKKLELGIVMEGVETVFQVKRMLDLNCDYLQGYYFSKPISGKEFIIYVKTFKAPQVCREYEAQSN